MTSPPFPADEKMIKHMRSRLGFGAYLGAKLPLAAFAGLRIDTFDAGQCAVSLPYGWRTQNPFQSIYFAAQCMAAELSTGALAMLPIQSSNESVSMLVTNMNACLAKRQPNAVHSCALMVYKSLRPSITLLKRVKGSL